MLDRLCAALATGLGISYIAGPVAGRKWTGAGTLGTLQGLLIWFLLPSSPVAYAAVVAAAAALACWICGRAERTLGRHDDPRIVLDEVVGFWVAAAGLPHEAPVVAASFAAFRLLDSVKLPPYRWLERLPGGLGIVADDLGAGLAANLLVRIILWRWVWSP